MPRKQKKYHYIYKTTNILNNKYYIGMHSTDDLADGYVGSGKRLWYSINKHGKENHVCEILEHVCDRKSLQLREAEIVNMELLQDVLCMNLTTGGHGSWEHFNNDKEAIRKRNIKCAAARTRKIKTNKEYRQTLIDRIVAMNKANSYDSPRFTGMQHTEETKAKMRESAKGKQVGKKNSQYGTCWVKENNDTKPKKIKLEDLETYLAMGYRKGRK